jgi:hypothetical protein
MVEEASGRRMNWGGAAVFAAVGLGALALVAIAIRHRGGAQDANARVEPIAPEPSARVTAVEDAGPVKAAFMVEGGVDGGLSSQCMSLMAANRATVTRATSGGCFGQESELACITTATGVTWGYEVMMAKTTDDNSAAPDSGDWSDFQCKTEEQVRIVRIDGYGTKTTGPSETIERTWYATRTLSFEALVDYDGDGEIEVLRVKDGHEHEGGPVREISLLTFAKGTIGPYAPATKYDFVAIEDIDGDGRPDLVTRGPYGHVDSSDVFGNTWPAGPAMFAAHSRPDGTFALGDPESIAFTRTTCPKRPALSFGHDELVFASGAEKKIVCARLRGATQADVERAWKTACPAQDGGAVNMGMDCEDWPKELGAVAPPFALK